ncbi:MAG: hypothetical protein AB1546_10925, partial [bacterium]
DGMKQKVIDIEYEYEEIYSPTKFKNIIIYFKPEFNSIWIYDIEKKKTKRIGYNVNINETFPTQNGKLAVKFIDDTTEIPALPGYSGFLRKIKYLITKRRSNIVVVDPSTIKEPLR